MTRKVPMGALLFAMSAAGCTAGPVPKDNGTDDSAGDACREGLNSASVEGFSWVDLTVDGLAMLPEAGSACVSAEGLALEHRFSVEDQDGLVLVELSAAGAYGIPAAEILALRVEWGAQAWNVTDFFAGSVSATVNGDLAEGALEGEATGADGQLNVNLVWSVALP